MKEETYRKVFIKTEADLPKERTILIAHFKHSERWTDLIYFNTSDDDEYWLSEIDWYLQPVTAKTDQDDEIDLSSPDYYRMCEKCNTKFWTKCKSDTICESCNSSITIPMAKTEQALPNDYVKSQITGPVQQETNEQEIIKALSGEKIEDVKTVTSTDYEQPRRVSAEEIDKFRYILLEHELENKTVFTSNEFHTIWNAVKEFASQHPIGQEKRLPLDLDNPWSTEDVIDKLIWATEYLLQHQSYDGHNHEELQLCAKRGKEIIKEIQSQHKAEVEQEKPSEQSAEEMIDLQQYVTNLLYYAHIEAMDMHSIDFDRWVESQVDNIKEFYASQKHLPDVKKFSDRLDQIFEQGMPTKAQIIDAFNKFSGERHLPTDERVSLKQFLIWYCDEIRERHFEDEYIEWVLDEYFKSPKDKLNNKEK